MFSILHGLTMLLVWDLITVFAVYIVASIMTFPIAAWGAISFPGTPKDGRRWFFTQDEFDMATKRMAQQGRLNPKGLTLSLNSVKRFLGRWHFWVLIPWNIMWLMGYESMITGSPTLWLRSNSQYSVVQVNNFTVSQVPAIFLDCKNANNTKGYQP